MSTIKAVVNAGKDKDTSKKMSEREMYLLKALLNLLLYNGALKQEGGEGSLFFTSPESMPTQLPFNMPINMG